MKKNLKIIIILLAIVVVIGSSFCIIQNTNAEETSGKLTLIKTAKVTDSRKAKVTLEIQTSELEKPTTDVVLVVDTSGSMENTYCIEYDSPDNCIKKSTKTKMDAAILESNTMIDKLLPQNSIGNIRLAVISFGGSIKLEESTTATINGEEKVTFTNSNEVAKSAVSNFSAVGGTNVQDGLEKAKTLLTESTANKKIVILVSDGEPSYFFLNDGTQCGTGNSDALKDNWSGKDDQACFDSNLIPSTAAYIESDALKSESVGAEIYTIGFGTTTDNLTTFLTAVATPNTEGKDYVYLATDAVALEEALGVIANDIKETLATDANLTDIIPATFELTPESKTTLKDTYGDNITITENNDDTTTISLTYRELSSDFGTYKLEYEIQAKNEYSGVMKTNIEAQLKATATKFNSYYDKPKLDDNGNTMYDNDNNVVIDKSIELYFKQPVVPIAPITKDDDLTGTPIAENSKLIINKKQIIANDTANEILDEPGYGQNSNNITIPDSTINHKIVIDKQPTCGTIKIDGDNLIYSSTEGCAGTQTFEYHLESVAKIYDLTTLTVKEHELKSIALKDENEYQTSSAVELLIEPVKTTYEVEYLEQDTNKSLASSKIITENVFVYDTITESAIDIEQYNLVSNQTQTIKLKEDSNKIIFYYQKKVPQITKHELNKVVNTNDITTLKKEIIYNITYNATIIDYQGKVTITIVDSLPKKIIKDKSTYSCPNTNSYECKTEYNENTNKITYTLTTDVNTYKNGDLNIIFNNELSILYDHKDFDGTEKNITNSITAKLDVENISKTLETDVTTPTNIIGTVMTEYLYINEKDELEIIDENLNISKNYKIGTSYTTDKKDIYGYKYKEVKGETSGKVSEGTTSVTYIYDRIPANIISNTIARTREDNSDDITTSYTHTIKYKNEIEEYKGKAQITLVEHLPYPIDEEKSNIDGGEYNHENLTITWKKEYEVNTYDQINNVFGLELTVDLYYIDVIPKPEGIVNYANAELNLETLDKPIKTDKTTYVIESKKVYIQYEDTNGNTLKEELILYGFLDGEYEVKAPEIDGYNFNSVIGLEQGKFAEEPINIKYIYEKKKFTIIPNPNTSSKTFIILVCICVIAVTGAFIVVKNKRLSKKLLKKNELHPLE